MMKTSKEILKTAIPIAIGSLLFILYFLAVDKLACKLELERCESYQLSASVYLIFMFVIIVISSLYQISLGNWILKRSWNKLLLNIMNSIMLGLVFTLGLLAMDVFNGKAIEVKFYTRFFLVIFILGILFSILKWFFGKYLNKF